MLISKYVDYFHDGEFIDVNYANNNINFILESAEIDPDEIGKEIKTSKNETILGRLHVEGVKKITVNKQEILDQLTKNFDYGKIFDLEIKENFVELAIDWVNFRPKPQVNEFSVIQIEAEKIWWENIPDLEVPG